MDKRVIITLQDLKQLRPTAQLDGQRWEPFCTEAQDQDLRPVLGDALYYDFMNKFHVTADPMYASYTLLLNGTSYTLNGKTIYFDGLKPFVGYMTLARFIQNNQVNVTRYGIVQKTVNESQSVDPQVIRQVVNELRSNCVTYVNQIKTYLSENQTTFTLYDGGRSGQMMEFRMFRG